MAKPTKAQLKFLRQHTAENWQHKRGGYEDGFRPTWLTGIGGATYDFVGRCRKAGLIEIINGDNGSWPYSWKGTKLTEAGRAAIAPKAGA